MIADLDPGVALRLFGRYGADTPDLLQAAQPDELQPIDGAPSLWAELRWAARDEGVVHLDDLLAAPRTPGPAAAARRTAIPGSHPSDRAAGARLERRALGAGSEDYTSIVESML